MRWLQLLTRVRTPSRPARCFVCHRRLRPDDGLVFVNGRRCHIDCAQRAVQRPPIGQDHAGRRIA